MLTRIFLGGRQYSQSQKREEAGGSVSKKRMQWTQRLERERERDLKVLCCRLGE